jgi:hypothetical protein
MTTTQTTKWTKTNTANGIDTYTNTELPDILIRKSAKFEKYAVIDQDGTNKGWYDSLDEAAGIAKHLA